ncbi:hypothetical protein ACFYXI_11145 [Microtetraspora malaysiensis]|uniref:Uncharacterized protein n=1 Tax=Microtetraspora malaysiensis TaxID=161358 RepID=A0ABW6SMD4_9ACTN
MSRAIAARSRSTARSASRRLSRSSWWAYACRLAVARPMAQAATYITSARTVVSALGVFKISPASWAPEPAASRTGAQARVRREPCAATV